MKRSMLFVSLLASVAACSSGGSSDPSPGAAATTAPATTSSSGSGGGGSTTTADADPEFTYSSATGTQSRDTLATGADYGNPPPSSVTGFGNGNSVTLGTDPTSGDDTVTLNITNPDGSTISSHAFDMTTATTYAPTAGGVTATFSEVNQGDYDLKVDGAAVGDLSYVSYGLWNAPEGASGGYGVFAAGQPTSSSAMASLVSSAAVLNYAGQVIGQGTLGCGGTAGCGTYTVSGTFNQTINYGNGAVTGGVTLNADSGAGVTTLGSGTMTGSMDAGGASTYTLSNVNVATNAALAPAGLTGTGKGFVAGPTANETAFTAVMGDGAGGNGISIAGGGVKH